MAINNRDLTLFEEIIEVNDIREMGELEIAGALAYTYTIVREFQMLEQGESFLEFNDVDNNSFYCGKKLYLNDRQGYVVKYNEEWELILDHVFMREGSFDNLWGYAFWFNIESCEESDMFLVRI